MCHPNFLAERDESRDTLERAVPVDLSNGIDDALIGSSNSARLMPTE